MESNSGSTTYLFAFSDSVTLYILISHAILPNKQNYGIIPRETGIAFAFIFTVCTEVLSLKVTASKYWQKQYGTLN